MLDVPADSGIGCCASAEPLVVAKPHAGGKARARRVDNALVGQQRRSPCRKGGDEDLSVQVPSLHPSYEVADCAPGSRFLLGDHHLALLDRCVLRQPNSERGSRVRTVTAGYIASGRSKSKSMYSPRTMRCLILSGIGGCCTVVAAVAGAGEAEAAPEVGAPAVASLAAAVP